jgi:hypothetical protein
MADNDEHKHDLVNLAVIARRVDAIHYIVEKHGQTISEIVSEAVAIDMRVRSLEGLAQTRAITEAREDERDKSLYDRLGRMEEQIKETRAEIKGIKSVGSRALWIVGSGLLTAVVGFILKGGLA